MWSTLPISVDAPVLRHQAQQSQRHDTGSQVRESADKLDSPDVITYLKSEEQPNHILYYDEG